MKKLLILLLLIGAILVGLYFYTDGAILQGSFESGLIRQIPSEEALEDSIIKFQSSTLNKDNTLTLVLGNTSEDRLSRTFNATIYLNGELFAEQRFPALQGLTGTEWTSSPLPSGEHELKVCIDEENAIEAVDNCQIRNLQVQE